MRFRFFDQLGHIVKGNVIILNGPPDAMGVTKGTIFIFGKRIHDGYYDDEWLRGRRRIGDAVV